MASTLIFPDGVRLAGRDEIPGPESARADAWARMQAADISQGFVLSHAEDQRFVFYAEVNVHAPAIWPVFRALCRSLPEPEATLLFAEPDDEPRALGSADLATILDALGRHEYQLAHDGFLQFGVVGEGAGRFNEIFVTPTKHMKVWLNDETLFRSLMADYGIPENSRLEFLDQYPRTTTRLPPDTGALWDMDAFAALLASEIGVRPPTH